MPGTSMLEGLWKLYDVGWNEFFEKYRDPRVHNWFLMSSPYPMLILLVLYLYFCLNLGPKLMANRKPFELNNVLLIYNFANVLLSIYGCNEALQAGWLRDYSFTCQPVDYSNTPKAIRMAGAAHFYFILKIIELLDTIFFVLRKKNNQITGLHVYHHTIMVFVTWICAAFTPGGQPSMQALTNTFVHVIMYSYYFLSTIVPPQYLWWKKYITTLQLTQFVAMVLFQGQVLFNGCDIPKFMSWVCISQTFIFIYLFTKFYIRTYLRPAKKST